MLFVSMSGCSTVAAYERETLARRDMALTRDPILRFGEDHARSYREGSIGGAAEVSGGGCGCN